jgi:hypothetical protein
MPTFEAAFPLLVVGSTHFDRIKLYLILKSDKSNQNIQEHPTTKYMNLRRCPTEKIRAGPLRGRAF